jgi:hypothetical protein
VGVVNSGHDLTADDLGNHIPVVSLDRLAVIDALFQNMDRETQYLPGCAQSGPAC